MGKDTSRKFDREGQDAVTAIASWVKHPETRELVESVAPGIVKLVEPIEGLLVDQIAITAFSLRAAGDPHGGIDIFGQDLIVEANPWPAGLARLNESERQIARVVLTLFADRLRMEARNLAQRGAAIDPESPLDLMALGQLLLLKTDWTLNPREIAEGLNLIGPSAITPDGRGIAEHRDGRSARGAANIESIRSEFRRGLGGAALRAPYAKGSTRKVRSNTTARRDALCRVIAEHPDATAATILAGWRQGSRTTAGGMMRDLLNAEVDKPPSRRTLERDFEALRTGDR